MKKLKWIIMAALCLFSPFAAESRDIFDVKLTLKVPRVYANTSSLGYRKYQKQRITGTMAWDYDNEGNLTNVVFYGFYNKTHKMSNGMNVTYDAWLGDAVYPRFNIIGNNRTGKFKTPSVCFYLIAEPSYNIGQLDEDNALYVTLSGQGLTDSRKGYVKKLYGNVAGTLGCGCSAYGHLSPTRMIGYWGWTS